MYEETDWKLEGYRLSFKGPWERASWLYATMRQAGITSMWGPGGLSVDKSEADAALAFDKAAGPTPERPAVSDEENERMAAFYALGAGWREDFHADG